MRTVSFVMEQDQMGETMRGITRSSSASTTSQLDLCAMAFARGEHFIGEHLICERDRVRFNTSADVLWLVWRDAQGVWFNLHNSSWPTRRKVINEVLRAVGYDVNLVASGGATWAKVEVDGPLVRIDASWPYCVMGRLTELALKAARNRDVRRQLAGV